MYDKSECCRLIFDAVKIALQEAVFWLLARIRWDVCFSATRLFIFSPSAFFMTCCSGWYVPKFGNCHQVKLFQRSLFASICLLFSSAFLFSESQLRFSFDTRTLHLGIITSPWTNRVWHSGVSAAVQSPLSSVPGARWSYTRKQARVLVRSGLKGQWIFLSRRSWHCDHSYCIYRE